MPYKLFDHPEALKLVESITGLHNPATGRRYNQLQAAHAEELACVLHFVPPSDKAQGVPRKLLGLSRVFRRE